jgi:hypothetical protein
MSTNDPREREPEREQRAPWPPETQRSSAGPGSSSATTTAAADDAAARRASSPAGGTRAPTTSADGSHANAATRLRAGPAGAALAIAALVLGLVLGAAGIKLIDSAGKDGNPLAGNIDTGRFQAVILTNDKVYFGRLTEVNDTFFRLDDAFFLRETRESADAEPVRTLLPVNRELHAPENRMLIRQDEVVLVENLAKDSPVLGEIKRQTGGSGR